MYDYFISLGWNCLTASSLGKYGARSFAGPFDWVWSDLKQVLCCIEDDFDDFLKKDNVKVKECSPTYFEDGSYEIQFFHDVKYNFNVEYEEIYNKYMRRIEKFREAAKHRVCYIRLVRNQQEINYILENEEYIKHIIKRNNMESDIILLIPKFLRGGIESFRVFYLDIYDYDVFWGDGTRDIFSMNNSLMDWMEKNMDATKKKDNLVYNLRREMSVNQKLTQRELIDRVIILQDKLSMMSAKYQRLLLVENADFDEKSVPEKTVIYGCGDVGKALYKKLKPKCKVMFFIDSYLQETEFDGIPILKPDVGMKVAEKMTIVITVHDFEKVTSLLQKFYGVDNHIVSLNTFCGDTVM